MRRIEDVTDFQRRLDQRMEWELARFMRRRLMNAMALSGIAVWFVALFPALPSSGLRKAVLSTFALCAAATLLFAAKEWRLRRSTREGSGG